MVDVSHVHWVTVTNNGALTHNASPLGEIHTSHENAHVSASLAELSVFGIIRIKGGNGTGFKWPAMNIAFPKQPTRLEGFNRIINAWRI